MCKNGLSILLIFLFVVIRYSAITESSRRPILPLYVRLGGGGNIHGIKEG